MGFEFAKTNVAAVVYTKRCKTGYQTSQHTFLSILTKATSFEFHTYSRIVYCYFRQYVSVAPNRLHIRVSHELRRPYGSKGKTAAMPAMKMYSAAQM